MKVDMPACSECKTDKYVVRDRTAEKIGTATGGVIGVGVAFYGAKAGAETGAAVGASLGTFLLPVVGTAAGATAGSILGFLSVSTAGHAVGEVIDSKIRMKFRCTGCGKEICG
jgi:hypothetical protein